EGCHQETRPGEARGRAITRQVAAGALATAGLGAFLYHAGLTAWAARLDGTTVAVLAGALGLHTVTRLAPLPGGRRLPRSHWRSLAPWLLLALGAVCWWLGRSEGPWCRSESLVQAHAAWHFLAAAAIGSWLASGRSGPQPPTPSSLRAERQPDL
ncbi:MAG: hypothetical protein H6Q11_1543, partial [Acidobacteria bacterium]|nr:hypothetical protein [Acidobacteriota bacterium]